MTSESEEELFSSLALPVIIRPILDRMAELNSVKQGTVEHLQIKFQQIENQNPGFTFKLVSKILKKAGIDSKVDIAESLLRMEGSNHSDEFQINMSDEAVLALNERSTNLKKTLSRIPSEINDRKRFLETIKDIASAIRLLLDSVNEVLPLAKKDRSNLEGHKKDFVKYSRIFSNTLKEFFRDYNKRAVFVSGNHLVNQCNLLMKATKQSLTGADH